jgi:hypothetical protein
MGFFEEEKYREFQFITYPRLKEVLGDYTIYRGLKVTCIYLKGLPMAGHGLWSWRVYRRYFISTTPAGENRG